jgi:hypothetical protein
MKSLIFKETTTNKNTETTKVYFCGICIYCEQYPTDEDKNRRPIGFVQYPNDAPGFIEDEDWFDEDDE